MDSYNSPSTKPLFKAVQIVWYIIGIIETLLLFRLVLKLLGANPAAVFTNLVYDLSSLFVSPFVSVFRTSYVQGAVFEWTTLLAMLVYVIIGYAIVNLLVMSRTVSSTEAAVGLRNEEN